MVYVMSRNPIHAVTLPVLVNAEKREGADGWVTFYPGPHNKRSVAVRVITPGEVKRRLREIFPKPEDVSLFNGTTGLKFAYETEDELAFQRHFENVRPWLESVAKGARTQWSFESSPKRPNWGAGVRWVYSTLINRLLRDARLIMWCSDKELRFLPGVYCPDWKTAAFATVLVNHLRVCPKCDVPFIPRIPKQYYCKPSHREAHRVARSRLRAKQRGE